MVLGGFEYHVWWIYKGVTHPWALSLWENLLESGWKLQALWEKRWVAYCFFFHTLIQSLLLNYFLWVRIVRISLIALSFPTTPNPFFKRGQMNVIDNSLYAVKATGRSMSCTWTSGIRPSLGRTEPAASGGWSCFYGEHRWCRGWRGVESGKVAHLLGHRQAHVDIWSSVSCSSRNCLGQRSQQVR